MGDLARAFLRVGLISFGGPAGQIALMNHEIVDERGWIDQNEFLSALNLCHLLPGPEAQQLATWIGWRLHGLRGGVIAGGLFVLPGACVMLGLALAYVWAAGIALVSGLFLGVKAAVVALVAQALIRVARRALVGRLRQVLAGLAFLALFFGHVPFPLVIGAAALMGAVLARVRPDWLGLKPVAAAPGAPGVSHRRQALHSLVTALIGLAVWWAPMLLIAATLGRGHVLWRIGTFFARLAVVSFGGAYAVLAYMAQAAVGQYHWLGAADMANGLGLAETTPGPLILVTQFVGFLAGWRAPAPFSPLGGAVLAAALTSWMTFAPCFLWIFTAAPWLTRLEHALRAQGALGAITAAVVGVIANLALWFALHVLFARDAGLVPDPASLDARAAAIALGAGWLLVRRGWSVLSVLGVAALAGVGLSLV